MRVGIYEVERELGRGGMGAAYLARDPRSGARVVVKRLRWLDADALARFEREARIGAALHHDGIVKTLDFGRDEQGPFLAMEWIDGETLAAILARGPLPPRRAAELVRDAAVAVHHAHARGVVHRDLKPANILVDARGRPRVADFGLSRAATDGTLSATGELLGTPRYVPPEQVTEGARAHGVAGDVWALGAILHEALAGSPAFDAPSTLALLQKISKEAPAPLPPGVPRRLAAIVERCLEKDPRARFLNAALLAGALDATLVAKPARRRSPALIGLAALVAVLAAIAFFAWPRERVAPPPPPPPPPPRVPPPTLGERVARALAAAEAAHRANRLTETVAIVTSALALDPGSTRAHEIRALTLFELGRIPEAQADMRAIEGHPLDARGVLLAEALLRNGAGMEALVRDDRKDEDAWLAFALRAMVRIRAKDSARGLEDTTRALALAPESAPTLLLDGTARVSLEDYAGAIEHFDAVIARCADLRELARWEKAGAFASMGDPAGARAALDLLIAEADQPMYRFARGKALVNLGATEEALADFAASIRLGLPREDGFLAAAHWQSAGCHIAAGRYEAALDECNLALGESPGDRNAYEAAVKAFRGARATPPARPLPDMEQASAAAPQDARWSMLAAAACQARGDKAGAIEHLRATLALIGAETEGGKTCAALIAELQQP